MSKSKLRVFLLLLDNDSNSFEAKTFISKDLSFIDVKVDQPLYILVQLFLVYEMR